MGSHPAYIEHTHEEIHEGKHFVTTYAAVKNNAETIVLLLTTPDNTAVAHLLTKLRSSGEANFVLSENPTVSNVGTALTEINRNRNSANTAGVVVTHTPTTSDAGTVIYTEHQGSGQQRGADVRGDNEFVLKQNEQYLLTITSEAASNDLSVILDWYEARV